MSKTYVVTFGYDMGGPESGPRIETGQEFVEANSKEEAEQIIIDTYSDSDPSGYGGFEGCWAREATEKDVAELIEAMKMEPQYEPDIPDITDLEYWEDQGYSLDPRVWTGLDSVPEQWKYLLNEDIKSATSVESDDGLWVLEDIKQVKDSDGFYTDYTLWSNMNTGEWCCVFGDSELYTPEEGWTDAEFDTEEEAREWFDSYTGFDEDDIESATDVSRPNVDGDNLYGGRGQKTAWKLLDSKIINNINEPGKVRYSMWYQENEGWYVFIEGDPKLKTPSKKSNWDFDTNDEDEAYEFWESIDSYAPYTPYV